MAGKIRSSIYILPKHLYSTIQSVHYYVFTLLQESKNGIEASLRRQQDERKTLDSVHKKVIADKAKLEQRVTQLLERQRDSNSSANQITKMEADLARFVGCQNRKMLLQYKITINAHLHCTCTLIFNQWLLYLAHAHTIIIRTYCTG